MTPREKFLVREVPVHTWDLVLRRIMGAAGERGIECPITPHETAWLTAAASAHHRQGVPAGTSSGRDSSLARVKQHSTGDYSGHKERCGGETEFRLLHKARGASEEAA